MAPVEARGKKETLLIEEDEEFRRFDPEKFPALRTVFKKENGTITAANASKNSDGASALILTSEEEAHRRGLCPMARFICKNMHQQHCHRHSTGFSILF